MNKTSKPSTKRTRNTKIRSAKEAPVKWLEEYKDCFTLKTKPVTELFIERFFTDLVKQAAHDEDLLTIQGYYLYKGVNPDTYYSWVHKYPLAKMLHTTAMEMIGARREKGGLKRKYDSSMVASSMPLYNERWRELLEWRTLLREKENKAKGTIHVTIDQSPSSDMVPQRTPEEVAREAFKKSRSQH